MADLHPSTVRALKAKRTSISVVTRDGDSRMVAAGGGAELSARCQPGETPVSAAWGGLWGPVRDLFIFEDRVAVTFHNTQPFDVRAQLQAVCLKAA